MHAGDRLLAYALGKPTTFDNPEEVAEVKRTLISAMPAGPAVK